MLLDSRSIINLVRSSVLPETVEYISTVETTRMHEDTREVAAANMRVGDE